MAGQEGHAMSDESTIPSRASGRERRRRMGRSAGFAGRAAEDAALRRYARAGARLLSRNWRASRACGGGELDLVLEADGAIVFVEVKARRTLAEAAHALRPAQRARILRAAEAYLAERGATGRAIRFDVALCDRMGGMEIVENALWT